MASAKLSIKQLRDLLLKTKDDTHARDLIKEHKETWMKLKAQVQKTLSTQKQSSEYYGTLSVTREVNADYAEDKRAEHEFASDRAALLGLRQLAFYYFQRKALAKEEDERFDPGLEIVKYHPELSPTPTPTPALILAPYPGQENYSQELFVFDNPEVMRQFVQLYLDVAKQFGHTLGKIDDFLEDTMKFNSDGKEGCHLKFSSSEMYRAFYQVVQDQNIRLPIPMTKPIGGKPS